jgi:hypothetical protein
MKLKLLLIVGWCVTSCSSQPNPAEETTKTTEHHPDFSSYWYAGVAELNHYQLSQARYGEERKGDAVLIFVTEDFLPKKQVKNESADNSKSTTVLKTNYIKKFTTGIYDYSLMSSIFTPINSNEFPSTLKVSTSSQEWCGHTYLQLNKRKQNFEFTGHSYFMKEADEEGQIANVLLEDELFNRIRLDYQTIPTGEVDLLPSTQWLRLSHTAIKPQKAVISLTETEFALTLNIKYHKIEREVNIKFEKEFPNKILGWEESFPSGYGENRKIMTTTAVLDTTILSPYWSKNKNEDEKLRELLNPTDRN